ncbi:DUF2336 domain-containing protein [Chelatococcus sp. SYSU_G07232]|uniref:DUF2336 domain-containing protein n=1 Tax=Chelatococcus albus TaxID=3047466 RepID=A0ABT7AJJ0_9HYPH|nr:DUF2336 domain-containing protein [Chelatococcus sp. SYSU_G07232]MDJ1158756.1 DUF2336 domain-containing protein [Chelatococcus sp. SYSU_G07232]
MQGSGLSALVRDLDAAIARRPPEQRVETLRRVTDLFLRDAKALRGEHVDVFDIVIARLAAVIERRARIDLSERLADVPNAPIGVIRTLAQDDIVVARPVLTRSPCLTSSDLVAIAAAKGRDHMLAICERPYLPSAVTDALVMRGDRAVLHAVSRNAGAKFSRAGLEALIAKARADFALQAQLGQRVDIPEPHRTRLISIAKEAARRRLADALPEAAESDIASVVDAGAQSLAPRGSPERYAEAEAEVARLLSLGHLDEKAVAGFAESERFEECVLAITRLCGVSQAIAERTLTGDVELLVVLCRAQEWTWKTTRALIALQGPRGGRTAKRAYASFRSLAVETALRAVRALTLQEASRDIVGVSGAGM